MLFYSSSSATAILLHISQDYCFCCSSNNGLLFRKAERFSLAMAFGAVSILFNPIIPIHFYLKSIWIPIDIVTGILFLLLIFIRKKVKKIPKENLPKTLPQQKNLSRDRIIKTSLKKTNNNE